MKQQTLLDVDPTARRELDLYETPRWMVEALLRRVRMQPDWLIFEPCAGNERIATVLRAHGLQVRTSDIRQRGRHLDIEGDACNVNLWGNVATLWGAIDATVTNVPFVVAFPIIQLALEWTTSLVATIVNRTWDEPTKERDEWLAAHPCTAQIVMPRHKWRGTGNAQTTFAWYVWAKRPGIVLGDRFHHVVTRAERDELITRYGEAA